MMPQLPRGLYVVADPRFLPPDTDLLDYVSALAHAGTPTIQLRMKEASAAQVLDVAKRVMKIRRKHRFFFVVNDHPEVARAVGADAVHVGKADYQPHGGGEGGTRTALPGGGATLAHVIIQARAIVGPDIVIGYSSHSLDEAVVAAQAGADYVAFGAIFPTATKGEGHPVQDLQKLSDVVAAVSKPVVAIGGINRSNATDVWKCGVHALAMITGISRTPDMVSEVAWYRSLR